MLRMENLSSSSPSRGSGLAIRRGSASFTVPWSSAARTRRSAGARLPAIGPLENRAVIQLQQRNPARTSDRWSAGRSSRAGCALVTSLRSDRAGSTRPKQALCADDGGRGSHRCRPRGTSSSSRSPAGRSASGRCSARPPAVGQLIGRPDVYPRYLVHFTLFEKLTGRRDVESFSPNEELLSSIGAASVKTWRNDLHSHSPSSSSRGPFMRRPEEESRSPGEFKTGGSRPAGQRLSPAASFRSSDVRACLSS